jgi:NADH dehydrogenase
MSRNKSVVITGANGFVGKNVSKHLSKNGFKIIGIVRKGKKKTICSGECVISENFSERNLVSKIKNSSALLHFIGQGKQTIDSDYEKVNVSLTKNVIKLCKKAKIKKIIYISGLGVDKSTTLGYFISKFKAEQEIIHSGLDYTIFRASYIIGKDDPLSKNLRRQIKKGKVVIPGSGNYRLQPIFVGDVAKIMRESITRDSFSNKIFDLVGPQTVNYNTFVRKFVGRKKIKLTKVNFESVFYDALHNRGSFGIDDLSIMIGDYVGNPEKLARLVDAKFIKYDEVLKSGSLS